MARPLQHLRSMILRNNESKSFRGESATYEIALRDGVYTVTAHRGYRDSEVLYEGTDARKASDLYLDLQT